MLCSLFTDVADPVELVFGNNRWILIDQVIVFTAIFLLHRITFSLIGLSTAGDLEALFEDCQ